jgi:hypothetical protein
MRTTITLDPDVAAKLKAEMRRTGKKFRELVNSSLRRGLREEADAKPRKPFRVTPIASGERPGFNFDNIGELLAQIDFLESQAPDDPDHKK